MPHLVNIRLSHLQSQSLTAQDVEMQMLNGLTGVGAAVADHAITILQAFSLGDLGDHLKDVSNNSAVFSGDAVAIFNVGLGNHQHMGGSLGIDVPEGVDGFVLIDLGGRDLTGDNLAEQTHNQKTSNCVLQTKYVQGGVGADAHDDTGQDHAQGNG